MTTTATALRSSAPGPEPATGEHSADKGERRHQDRPQTVAAALDDGIVTPCPGAELIHVVDLKDRVLLHHAEEDEDAQRRIEVELLAVTKRAVNPAADYYSQHNYLLITPWRP